MEWELDHLERADVIVLFFQGGTMLLINLLDLGMHAQCGRLLACCPEGYWRRENVQVVRHRSSVLLVETKDELKQLIKDGLRVFLENAAISFIKRRDSVARILRFVQKYFH